MAEQKLATARQLIQEKHYDEARMLLKTIDHPKAREWLSKLEGLSSSPNNSRKAIAKQIGKLEVEIAELDTQIESRTSQRRAATIVFIFCLILAPVGIGIVLLPLALFNYFRHKRALSHLQDERQTAFEQLTDLRAELM